MTDTAPEEPVIIEEDLQEDGTYASTRIVYLDEMEETNPEAAALLRQLREENVERSNRPGQP